MQFLFRSSIGIEGVNMSQLLVTFIPNNDKKILYIFSYVCLYLQLMCVCLYYIMCHNHIEYFSSKYIHNAEKLRRASLEPGDEHVIGTCNKVKIHRTPISPDLTRSRRYFMFGLWFLIVWFSKMHFGMNLNWLDIPLMQNLINGLKKGTKITPNPRASIFY